MFNPVLLIMTILLCVVSYFIGNISPAILIGKAHGIDIKKEGSGNAGTTNVLRVLGKKAAVGTLIIDIGKGVVAVLLGRIAGKMYATGILGLTDGEAIHICVIGVAMFCALFVLAGHIWPMAFGFRGGKGVATGFGAITTIHPLIGVCCLGVVVVVVLLSRRVSVGSICGAASLPVLAVLYEPIFVPVSAIMAIIVILKHRSNIQRLLNHQEPKLF